MPRITSRARLPGDAGAVWRHGRRALVKDKLFWFVAYEGLRVKLGSTSSVTIRSSIGLTPRGPDLQHGGRVQRRQGLAGD